ncbi:MAG: hypothetical protein ACLFV7_14465 [Phycisphaerae bacterium]
MGQTRLLPRRGRLRSAATAVLLTAALLCTGARAGDKPPPGCLTAKDANAIEAALDAFFAADAAERVGVYRKRLAELPAGLTLEDLQRIAEAKAPRGRKHRHGVTRVKLPWLKDNPRGWVNVALPEDYTPARAWPVAVCLHGSGSDGDNVVPFYSPQLNRAGFITLYPTTTSKKHLWSTGVEMANVYRILSWAGTRWRIDFRRVVCTGGSMGGMGTWSHLLARPQLWSAGASVAGHPAAMKGDLLENLRPVPFYILHGEKDTDGASLAPVEHVRAAMAALKRRGIEPVYVEAPGAGHTPPMKYWREMNRWIARQPPQEHSPRSLLLPGPDGRALWQVQLDPLGLDGLTDPDLERIRQGKTQEARANLTCRIRKGDADATVFLLRAVSVVPGLLDDYPWDLQPNRFSEDDGWTTADESAAMKDLRTALNRSGGKGPTPGLFDAAVWVMIGKLHARRYAATVDAKGLAWVKHYNAAVAAVRASLRSSPGYVPAGRLATALKKRRPKLPRRRR